MSKLWPKYENWSKLGTEQQVYRYTPKVYRYTLAQNDQKRKCTGTLSKCTVTSHPKCLKMCVFSHFSIILILKSILYFQHTSNPFPIHLGISFLFNSSSNTYLYFKKYTMDYSQITLIWVMTHTQTKYKDLLGFVLTQLFYLAINP